MAESKVKPTSSIVPGIIIGVVCAALLAVMIVGYTNKNRTQKAKAAAAAPQMQRYGMVEDFDLTDQSGQPFSREAVDGKVWVANFIFTSCATECPYITRQMSKVDQAFSSDDRVELVSISVDPRTDSPERLTKYADSFDAGPKWSFVTGEENKVRHLSTNSFMVTAADGTAAQSSIPKTRQLLHSEKIAVVDQLGVIRFYANGMNPKASQQVVEVVRKLLAAGI